MKSLHPGAMASFMAIFIFSSICSAQDLKKHSIGVMGPVSLNSNLFTGASIDFNYALRYGYKVNPNLTIGPELSGFYIYSLIDNTRDMRSYKIRSGLYARYTFFPDSRLRPFIEGSVFVSHYRFVPGSDQVFDGRDELHNTRLTGYIAPGISLYSKNRKFSFDLMYKFAGSYYRYGSESGLTFRVNFHY